MGKTHQDILYQLNKDNSSNKKKGNVEKAGAQDWKKEFDEFFYCI